MKCIKELKTSTIAYGDEIYPRHSEASVTECSDGTLRIAWQRFENSEHGSNDTSPATIVMTELSFSEPHICRNEPRVIADRVDDCVNVYSPNLIRLCDGSLMFMYMRYNSLFPGKQRLSTGYYRISHDDGATFGEEHIIWEKKGILVHNDCIRRLRSGRLLVPVEKLFGTLWTPEDHCSASVMYSDDDGKTWEFSPHTVDLPMRGVMEPFVAECPNGSLVMVMRCQLGSVMRCYSFDNGITWTKPQTTGLPAPESCPFITNIPRSDTLMVVWNNSEYDPSYASHYGKRTPFTAAFSDDGGKNFYGFTDIEDNPKRAFSNPALTWLSDGRGILTYWTTEYLPSGSMGGKVDLKLATFRIEDR